MSPLLAQFLAEARESLQSIGERLLELEQSPDDAELMDDLFRVVHTLKGSSGLFEFPELTRVLHAGEDLMDAVRSARVSFTRNLADELLETMDFVSELIDEIESTEGIDVRHADMSLRLTESLRALLETDESTTATRLPVGNEPATQPTLPREQHEHVPVHAILSLGHLPEDLRTALHQRLEDGEELCWVCYRPEEECFFKGQDPFHQVRQLENLHWYRITPREPWPALLELDPYRCILDFELITSASASDMAEHFRYVSEQVEILPLTGQHVAVDPDPTEATPAPTPSGTNPTLLLSSDLDEETVWSFNVIVEAQREILNLTDTADWLNGRLRAVAISLTGAFTRIGRRNVIPELEQALETSIRARSSAPMLAWLDRLTSTETTTEQTPSIPATPHVSMESPMEQESVTTTATDSPAPEPSGERTFSSADEEEPKAGRRAEDHQTSARTLKVDQVKIDRLMNLIGEMVVAKNALPYLAGRAEEEFGVRELSREIKAQYSVINRIAEEMQDAIMQVRMLPVSFVFQRFPRLVRDTARKLGKEVRLVMEGESTEADKNIIESLADPLIHIVRNSLDHGLEPPDVRQNAGKAREGTLRIQARQESDRVMIEISDDGRGIDPDAVRRRAYERNLIDEEALEHLSDQEAVNLVFAPGFSTAAQVTDLSGRGVGMDVVRTAVSKVNGEVELHSTLGAGTRLRLSLPLSMAVSNVMIIESSGQRFGVPMDAVSETVRVHSDQIRRIKHQLTAVLRERLVPLVPLNELLGLDSDQIPNEDGEYAVLVVRIEKDFLGIIVDDCRETIDIILKPMTGILGGVGAYAGSALLGDGSVLLVLNPRELL